MIIINQLNNSEKLSFITTLEYYYCSHLSSKVNDEFESNFKFSYKFSGFYLKKICYFNFYINIGKKRIATTH